MISGFTNLGQNGGCLKTPFLLPVQRIKRQNRLRVKRYWEIIAENPKKAGWSWGCVSAIDSGTVIFKANFPFVVLFALE